MSQQTDQQITDKIDAAYTGGSDRVEWTNELKVIVKDLNDSKVSRSDATFTELNGTTWDGINKYKSSLSGDLAITLNSTRVAGLLVIEDNNSHTLTINGVNIPINATTATVIGFTKANGVYYIIDKDGLTITVAADVTAPTVVSATAINANTIRIVFSESMGAVTTAGHSFKQNGSTITPDSVSGATTTWDFVFSETLLDTDTLLRTYNSGTGATTDVAGNELASYTDQSVTNSIPPAGDADVDAFIAAVEGAGYAMSTTEEDALLDMVSGLKSASLWTKTKAFYPLFGTSIGHAKWNLKNPLDSDGAFRLTNTGTFTFSDGATCTSGGNSDLLDTKIPAVADGQNNVSLFFSTSSNIAEIKCEMGVIDNVTQIYMISRTTTDEYWAKIHDNDANGLVSATNASGAGRYYAVRRGGTDTEIYKNGSSLATSTDPSATPSSNNIVICNGGTGTLGATTRKITLAGVFQALSDAEVTALDGLISSLLTALGR